MTKMVIISEINLHFLNDAKRINFRHSRLYVNENRHSQQVGVIV